MEWFVYIVACADGSLYTGISTDLERRVKEHNSKTGAKALKGKLPVILVYLETFRNRSEASVREMSIKKLNRTQKLILVGSKINK